jgi:hypothetical protein
MLFVPLQQRAPAASAAAGPCCSWQAMPLLHAVHTVALCCAYLLQRCWSQHSILYPNSNLQSNESTNLVVLF